MYGHVNLTMLVPGEGITQLLTIEVNVKSNGYEHVIHVGSLVKNCDVLVIISK